MTARARLGLGGLRPHWARGGPECSFSFLAPRTGRRRLPGASAVRGNFYDDGGALCLLCPGRRPHVDLEPSKRGCWPSATEQLISLTSAGLGGNGRVRTVAARLDSSTQASGERGQWSVSNVAGDTGWGSRERTARGTGGTQASVIHADAHALSTSRRRNICEAQCLAPVP